MFHISNSEHFRLKVCQFVPKCYFGTNNNKQFAVLNPTSFKLVYSKK